LRWRGIDRPCKRAYKWILAQLLRRSHSATKSGWSLPLGYKTWPWHPIIAITAKNNATTAISTGGERGRSMAVAVFGALLLLLELSEEVEPGVLLAGLIV
jgi:hypothetical protein